MLRKPRTRATFFNRAFGWSSVSANSTTSPPNTVLKWSSPIGRGKLARTTSSPAGLTVVVAARWTKSSTNRYTPAEKPPISRAALTTMASKTGCTSPGELAMTFNISAVAACCSRASCNSLARAETIERFDRAGVVAVRRLVLAGLRVFAELTLRVFRPLLLPPVLDGRAILTPRGFNITILSGDYTIQEGARERESSADCDFRSAPKFGNRRLRRLGPKSAHPRYCILSRLHRSSSSPNGKDAASRLAA